jgi:glycosyltransferase involved in cell wall biosynthesis
MKVSLIIPTYNRTDVLQETIELALQQDYPDYEIIVVDQTRNNPPQLQDYLNSLEGNITYVRQDRPSLTIARNRGIRMATGEIIVFIDDDVLIQSDFLKHHVETYKDDSVGGVMGVNYPDSQTPFSSLAQELYDSHKTPRLPRMGEILPVTHGRGCNFSFRRVVLFEAGLFDEYFQGSANHEDFDISVRVRSLGYQFLLNTNIYLIHLAEFAGGCGNRKGGEKLSKQAEQTRNILYFFVKNHRMEGIGNILKYLWTGYRNVALNRYRFREGLFSVIHAHFLYLNSVIRGIRDGLVNSRTYPFPPTYKPELVNPIASQHAISH